MLGGEYVCVQGIYEAVERNTLPVIPYPALPGYVADCIIDIASKQTQRWRKRLTSAESSDGRRASKHCITFDTSRRSKPFASGSLAT